MVALTGEEKAAVLLLSLPTGITERVLALLPERSEMLRGHMQRLEKEPDSQELMDQVLREFDELLREAPPGAIVNAVAGYVQANSGEAGGPSQAAGAAEAAEGQSQEEEEPADTLAALSKLSPDRLAMALEEEHPRTTALILDFLNAEQAGAVLKRLPTDTRRDVSVQMSHSVRSNLDVVQRIARAVWRKSKTLGDTPIRQETGQARFKKMAEMFRSLDKPERMELLANLEQDDSEAAAAIKEYLYHFEDILLIEDRSMQKLLSEIDSKTLAVALKGSAPAITEKVMGNLSQRVRETLTEEMDLLGGVPNVQVQQAQKMVVEVIQRLDHTGELVMTQ